MARVLVALVVVCSLSPAAQARERALDPCAIAQGYAEEQEPEPIALELLLYRPGRRPEWLPPPLYTAPTMGDLLVAARLDTHPALDPPAPLLASLGFDGDTSLVARLTTLQSRLFVRFGAYSGDREQQAEVRQGHFAGLTNSDEHRGQTLSLGGGAVLGDLSLSVGTVESGVTLAQVMAGQATVLDLNPFRDVRAQFDLAFAALPRGLRKRLPAPLLIVRISMAYLDAFTRASTGTNNTGGVDTDSEVGLAGGVTW